MVLVLSDGGSGVLRVVKQLEVRDEKYVVYFTNFLGAGRFGKGSVIVGDGSAASINSAVVKNRVTAIIDAVEEPRSRLSVTAYSVCRGRIKYIKYVNMEESYGARKCLSYRQLAAMIRRGKGAVVYASPITASGIVAEGGDGIAEMMYVPVLKNAVFDTDAALEYSVPIINVIETDAVDGMGAVKDMLKRTGTSMLVCDTTVNAADKAEIGDALNIPVLITHNMGMEYPEMAAAARDAAMFVRADA